MTYSETDIRILSAFERTLSNIDITSYEAIIIFINDLNKIYSSTMFNGIGINAVIDIIIGDDEDEHQDDRLEFLYMLRAYLEIYEIDNDLLSKLVEDHYCISKNIFMNKTTINDVVKHEIDVDNEDVSFDLIYLLKIYNKDIENIILKVKNERIKK